MKVKDFHPCRCVCVTLSLWFSPAEQKIPVIRTHSYLGKGSDVGRLLIRVFLQTTGAFARGLLEHQPATSIDLQYTYKFY